MEEEAQSHRGQSRQPSGKITPLQLRERYHLQTVELAQQAQVEPCAVYFLWLDYPVARQEAERVLAAISALSGQRYTLDNVRVVLVPEDEKRAGQAEPPENAPGRESGGTDHHGQNR